MNRMYLALVQEGRRQEAGGRRQEGLSSKLFNLFQLDSYFCHAALVIAIALTMGLGLPVAQTQTPQLVTSLAFNKLSLNQPRQSAPPPTRDRGAPRDRKGGASHAT